jgi:hypothetical protein
VFAVTLHSSDYGADRIENAVLVLLSLRVFGREVFNGQLPSNAVTIHVTVH